MRWTQKLNESIKRSVRSWLNVVPANPYNIQINEVLDFETNAIRNRIWYRGDSSELEQMYQQNPEYADKYKFWACKCSPGMEMRKIHTGLPGLIVRTLSSIVLDDMNDFEFKDAKQETLWKEIEKNNKIKKKMEKALKDALYIGDGAFKVTINTKKSQYPILKWYPGDRVELVRDGGDELQEVVFKTPYSDHGRTYVLNERYGYGYIINELYLQDKLVDIKSIPATANLADWKFDESVILAVPLQIYESAKYEGRGGSIFDGKLDSFDAFDEAWSQWMDALRAGRAKTYIPECLVPHDPETGRLIKPNMFDNRYFAADGDMRDKQQNVINTDQPVIPHESYLASYVTALDLCLQGIISPSTLVATCINAYHLLMGEGVEDVDVNIPFGEYANPSFESQVETVGKAKTQGIMSIERCVEELYGDTLDEHCKQEEIARLKAEQGISEVEEPALNLEGVNVIEGENRTQNIPNVPEGVPGTAGGGKGTGASGNIRPGKS